MPLPVPDHEPEVGRLLLTQPLPLVRRAQGQTALGIARERPLHNLDDMILVRFDQQKP